MSNMNTSVIGYTMQRSLKDPLHAHRTTDIVNKYEPRFHEEGLLARLETLGDFGDFTPSWDSCSKKSDQSSAIDSFLVPLSGKKSVDNAGVLGVRCHGDIGTLRFGFDAPGRAKPACSRCSATVSVTGKG